MPVNCNALFWVHTGAVNQTRNMATQPDWKLLANDTNDTSQTSLFHSLLLHGDLSLLLLRPQIKKLDTADL